MATGQQLYSAEEAAEVLGLQVRTVRNYVREGRLPGVKVGKQYRITRADLDAFTGGGVLQAELPAQGRPQPSVEASTVVTLEGVSSEMATRVGRTVEAFAAGSAAAMQSLHAEAVYDDQRRRLRVIIVGTATDTADLLRVIDRLSSEAG